MVSIVIILIDSNAFIADPYCKGVAWRALVHAAPAWGLRIATTEVAVAEATAKHERFIDARHQDLTKLSASLGLFGLGEVLARPLAMIAAARDAYPDTFRKTLESCGVEIIEIPNIPHMKLVERAVKRRRPCDDNGNGYRDTLNWLILLRMAESNIEEQIAWISDDSDFLASDGSGFHADLIADLKAINASNRVLWYRSIRTLVQKLAAEKSASAGDDLRAVADQLQKKSIEDYLTTEIVPRVLNSPLNVYRCGLPFGTKSARLLGITDINDLDVDLTGAISGDQLLAQFTLKATANIEIIYEDGQPESEESPNPEGGRTEATVSKVLLFRGIITLTSQGKPLAAELSVIEAADDDPGRRNWDEALAMSKLLQDAILPKLPQGYFDAIVPKFPQGYLDAIVPKLPQGYFDSILPKLPPDLFKGLAFGSAGRSPDTSADDDDDDDGNGESSSSDD